MGSPHQTLPLQPGISQALIWRAAIKQAATNSTGLLEFTTAPHKTHISKNKTGFTGGQSSEIMQSIMPMPWALQIQLGWKIFNDSWFDLALLLAVGRIGASAPGWWVVRGKPYPHIFALFLLHSLLGMPVHMGGSSKIIQNHTPAKHSGVYCIYIGRGPQTTKRFAAGDKCQWSNGDHPCTVSIMHIPHPC